MDSAVSHHPYAAVVALSGELDAHTAAQLRTLLAEQLLAGPGNLVLDLSALSFIDSAGLATLIAADKGTRRAGMKLVLAAPAPAVRKVLKITGIDGVLATKDTVDEALALLAPTF
ncbi:MAG: STAS domain-containing protein [Frankiales bacterium]|nr:STAS domain-containing protein [Frankiales bacterium]